MTGGKLKLGGKHKREARGSIEEEQTCKRSNMASEESEFIDKETNITQAEEPTRLELKEMLVDIRLNSQILCERTISLQTRWRGSGTQYRNRKSH